MRFAGWLRLTLVAPSAKHSPHAPMALPSQCQCSVVLKDLKLNKGPTNYVAGPTHHVA